MNTPATQPRWWGIYLRGLAMGFADLVPGVSGGTIAFITGIYDRLLTAIKVVSSPLALSQLLRLRINTYWKAGDCTFLALLGAGILTAVLLGVNVVGELLDNHTTLLLAFFFGLTLGAAFHIMRTGQLREPHLLTLILLGLLLAWLLQAAAPTELSTSPNLQAYFASGMLALCAMILPGVSGSLLLLLLGVYPFLVDAVRECDLIVIGTFLAGGVLGLTLFARLLRLLLVKWPRHTLALLVGVMLGALPRLWPWRGDEPGIKPILQAPVTPDAIAEPQLLGVAVCLVAGLLIIHVLDFIAQRMQAS